MRPLAALLALTLALAAASTVSAAEPIRIALTGPVGQEVVARVAGEALKAAEYDVEYVPVAPEEVFALLTAGEIHLQPEVDPAEAGPGYQAALDARGIARLGKLGIEPDTVIKVAWRNAAIKWSGAIKMMRTMSIASADRDAMIAAVENGGKTPEQAVAAWMAENEDIWRRWMSSNKNWMTPN